ncbi:MAG: hypothetical protein AAB504_02980 [Patescibacteria group bacterium]
MSKFKIIVIDIDGVLIQNKLARFFGNGNSLWLGKKPWLKKALFSVVEIVEFLFGIKHIPNKELADSLNVFRADNQVSFFIMTDRSLFGLRNTRDQILLDLTASDFIQVRGDNKLQEKWRALKAEKKVAKKNKGRHWIRIIQCEIKKTEKEIIRESMAIKESLKTKANIIFSPVVKPNKDVLSHLIAITKTEDLRKVLVVDNDQNFLEVAKSYEFDTFPKMYFSKEKEAFDAFGFFLERVLKKR